MATTVAKKKPAKKKAAKSTATKASGKAAVTKAPRKKKYERMLESLDRLSGITPADRERMDKEDAANRKAVNVAMSKAKTLQFAIRVERLAFIDIDTSLYGLDLTNDDDKRKLLAIAAKHFTDETGIPADAEGLTDVKCNVTLWGRRGSLPAASFQLESTWESRKLAQEFADKGRGPDFHHDGIRLNY